MVYTMSEILEYAEYAGQMAKIESGCNLIIESAIESLSVADTEEAYTEGVESVVNSLITLVSTAFKTIADFIGKQVEKVDNIINGKKYQMMMSPEMKAKFDEVTAGKDVKGIDTVALLKLSKKSEAFIDKFMATVNGEISKAQSDPSYDTSHLKDYCKNSEEAYDKLYKEMERVGTTKKSLKKADFYAMVKAGNEINTSMKDYKKKMHSMEKQLTATIKKLNKAGYLKEFAEGDTEFRVYNEGVISSIKSGIQKVINSLKNFCIKHARACQYVCMGISVLCGIIGMDTYTNGVRADTAYDARKSKYTKRMDELDEKFDNVDKYADELRKNNPNMTETELNAAINKYKRDNTNELVGVINKYGKDRRKREKERKTEYKKTVAGIGGSVAGAIGASYFKKVADEQDRQQKGN